MSRPTAPPQPDEEAPPQPQPAQAPSSSSLMAIIALILRIITWVLLSLLATGVGAAFGATLDLKKNLDDLDDILQENYDNTALSLIRAKLDDFFGKAYVSAGFLLFAFITSVISSVLSSLELTKKTY
ncbi:CASP 4D1 [Olea europaea subsp. europaea]|uniref:CASP 4D1 n=1 Tax=Olea europaea subsp. europaea TaxID=158383 RepID=A0A8S0SVQ7_OLEEU|nr:CASP 4D1 [Olea europaea subsp. europaea]